MKKDHREDKEAKPLIKQIEKFGLEFRKNMDRVQKERSDGKYIKVRRMMLCEILNDEKGECDNSTDPNKRKVVRAGNDMCSVGIVRKGRNWGDYSGVFCGECPYFIPIKRKRTCREVRE